MRNKKLLLIILLLAMLAPWAANAQDPCTITVFPWTEDFEGFTANTLPDCWDNSVSTSTTLSNHPDYIWGVYYYSSEENKMIRMWNWVTHEGTAAINSPDIILPSEGAYQLTFKYSHLADCGAFKVRISTDGGTTFTDLQEYANTTGTYSHFPGTFIEADPISLAEYSGQTVILQFFANATFSEGAIFVDDVAIEPAPCLPPSGLTVTQTSTGFHFAWDGQQGMTYGYSWGLAGEGHGASLYTGNSGHNNYIDLPFTQFNSNADYVFYVFKVCTADDWSDEATIGFHTPCDAVTTFPWTEDFQGFTVGIVPDCWDNSASTSSSLSNHPEHIWGVYHYDYYNSDENQMIRMWNYGVQAGTAVINSPEISLPSGGYDYQLTFKYSHRADCGPLKVRISADSGTTFTDLQEYTSTDSYDPYDPGTFAQADPISLVDYAGQTVILQFSANANYGHGAIFVDDVAIEPACLEPTGLTVTQTSTGFHFAWDGQSGMTYGYSWGLAGESHGASLYTGNSGHNNYIDLPYTQFNSNADYVFYVFKICTADDWSDEATIGFHTPCDAVTVFPSWTEDFQGFTVNTVPECWDNSASTSPTMNTNPYWIWGEYTYTNSENKMIAMRNAVVESGTALINSPWITLPSEGDYQLTFKYCHRADCGAFKIRISTDGGTTFTDLQEYASSGSYAFAPDTFTQADPISLVDYAGQTVILQFFANANHSAGAIFVDDVAIEPAPCLPPTGLTATSTATGFRFTWDAEQGAYWSYSLSLDGEQPGTPLATGNNGGNNYMDIDVGQSYCGVYVDYNTDYTFYVFRDCGGDILSDYVSVDFMAPIIIKAFTTAGYWNDADNWSPSGVPALLEDVVIRANAIIPNGCVATANSITYDGAPMPITIADGGQLIHKNDGVIAIVEKEITGYNGEKDHYYLIGVPQYDQTLIAPTNVQHMLDNDFDLYAFEQDAADGLEWRNYKVAEQPFFLYYGVGYLYANSEDVTLSAETILQPLNDEGYAVCNNYVALSYTNGGTNPLNGWNLVSNPWAFSGYMYVYDPINDEFVSQDFYRMGENSIEAVASQGTVAPWEAVFVEATAVNQFAMVYKNPVDINGKSLNMTVSRNGGMVDNARIRFGKGCGLGKFQLNPNHTKLYIPQSDKDYAVVYSEENMGEIPVSFKAEHNGAYTLSFDVEEVSFDYLHLIDNMTGVETDLLANPSYSFNARTSDYASRFKLVFATGSSTGSDAFAFFSHGSFVINNEGDATLQVIDVMGRILKSERVTGCANVNFDAASGVYMLRLINGNDVKVQKVVVR